MFTPYWIAFALARKTIIPDMIGLSILFTHKNDDFGAISATERNCAARCCLSSLIAFVGGCLWLKNETTNERLFALESRMDYFPCVNMVKRVWFERMTRSSDQFQTLRYGGGPVIQILR